MSVIDWCKCPNCQMKLLKLTKESIVRNEIYCRRCKTSFFVDIKGFDVKIEPMSGEQGPTHP